MREDFDSSRVVNGLLACAKARLRVFGSDKHCFQLNPRLTLEKIEDFERRHGIRLPVDYRKFLSEVGNGGAGPGYGVFPLGFMDDGWGIRPWVEGKGMVGVLKEPYPHEEPWNDESGMPDDGLFERDPCEYDRLVKTFEERYWNLAWVNGAIPICHMGCALRVWLIVSGKERGHLWRDGRAELSGLRPVVLKDESRATFSIWYLGWLDECLQMLSTTGH